jgi:hypothetical protein
MKFRWSYRNTLKNLCSWKLENEEEIDKFIDTYDLPKFNQEVIKNLNRSLRYNEIETVIRNLPTKKNPGPDGFTVEFLPGF